MIVIKQADGIKPVFNALAANVFTLFPSQSNVILVFLNCLRLWMCILLF